MNRIDTEQRYQVQGRNGYYAIDEYDAQGRCLRTIVAGITRKLALGWASSLDNAYQAGHTDGMAARDHDIAIENGWVDDEPYEPGLDALKPATSGLLHGLLACAPTLIAGDGEGLIVTVRQYGNAWAVCLSDEQSTAVAMLDSEPTAVALFDKINEQYGLVQ